MREPQQHRLKTVWYLILNVNFIGFRLIMGKHPGTDPWRQFKKGLTEVGRPVTPPFHRGADSTGPKTLAALLFLDLNWNSSFTSPHTMVSNGLLPENLTLPSIACFHWLLEFRQQNWSGRATQAPLTHYDSTWAPDARHQSIRFGVLPVGHQSCPGPVFSYYASISPFGAGNVYLLP